MLSIRSISSAKHAGHYYYEADGHYLEGGISPQDSQWCGRAAQMLNLSGSVEEKVFVQILEGVLPNGIEIGRSQGGKTIHACGLDLTFSAPKSASILSEVLGLAKVQEAHKQAVIIALEYAQDNLIYTRKQEGGKKSREQADNMLVAIFTHSTSRNLDPQLHTHCFIANIIQRADGNWRSADLKELYENKMLLGQIYRSAFAYLLSELGFIIEITGKNSLFEIKEVPQELRSIFSSRRKEIEEAQKTYNYVNAKTSEEAALRTRKAKQSIPKEVLLSKWQEIASNVGLTESSLSAALKNNAKIQEDVPLKQNPVQKIFEVFCQKLGINQQKHVTQTFLRENITAKDSIIYAVEHLSERSSLFSEKDIYYAAMHYSTGIITFNLIQKELIQAKKDKIVLSLHKQYTTQEALNRELHTIQMMKSAASTHKSIDTRKNIDTYLSTTTLNKGQKEAVRLILTSPNGIIGVQGYAGTGKTFMLKEASHVAQEKGYKLLGLAPTAAAANVLKNEANINAKTLHKLLFEYDGVIHGRGTQQGKNKMKQKMARTIIILDEATLASTKQIQSLLILARSLEVKTVLMGDIKQLRAVEAGKPFFELQKAGMETAIMDDIRRQKNQTLKEAVYYSIKAVDRCDRRAIELALNKIGSNFIVPKIGAKQSVVQALAVEAANQFLSVPHRKRETTLVVAPSNAIRESVNDIIRKNLQQEGEVSKTEYSINTLVSKGLTKPEMSQAFSYMQGDVVLFNRPYPSLGVNEGEYLTVRDTTKHNVVHLINARNKIIHWQPHKVGAPRNGAIEVYVPKTMKVAQGDHMVCNKNLSSDLLNSTRAKVKEISDSRITLQLETGHTKKFNVNDNALKHMDYAYASTVHAAQGRTVDIIIAVLESTHKHLSTQRALYVILSRSKYIAHLITDNVQKLVDTITANSGVKRSAVEIMKSPTIEKNDTHNVRQRVTQRA